MVMGRTLIALVGVAGLMGFASGDAARAATIFSEDFSDNSAGWTLGPQWEIGAAAASTGHAYGYPDPALDHTPTSDNGVAGVIIGGNAYHHDLHPYYYLVSPSFDATGYDTVSLEYYRWLNSDYAWYMLNRVEAFDGDTWQTLWQTGVAPGITDSEWTQQSFDLTALANENMAVRFGFSIESSESMIVSGWNLDDVTVTGTVPEPGAALGAFALAAFAFRRRRERCNRM